MVRVKYLMTVYLTRQITNSKYVFLPIYLFWLELANKILIHFCQILSLPLSYSRIWNNSRGKNIQSNLDISNTDISKSAKLEGSIWIKNTFWLLSPTIIWRWGFFCKSKLPEVQIYYTPPPTSWGGYTGITLSVRLSVRPGLSGVFLGYLSMNLSQTLYTSLSSWGIVHL